MDHNIPIVSSILHVTASDNLDISQDLTAEETKTISELIDDQEKKD